MSDLMNIFGAGGFDSITIKRAFELRDAALIYANNGWAVFPVHHILNDGQCSCGSEKCRDKQKYRGKHPVTHNGVLDATIDNKKIESWWDGTTLHNIGIATGKSSAIWVLDVDDGGDETIKSLELEFDKLPNTATSKTGSGGYHLIFTYDDRIKSRVKSLTGLDTRAEGGYIIAAPSNHYSGGSYEWLTDLKPVETAPEWLIAKLNERHEPVKISHQQTEIKFTGDIDFDELVEAIQFIPAENRDDWLHVGMALKDTNNAAAFDLWDAWSRRTNADNYDHKSQMSVWKSFKGGSITIATVYDLAIKNGWVKKFPERDLSHVDLSGILSFLNPKEEKIEEKEIEETFPVEQEEIVLHVEPEELEKPISEPTKDPMLCAPGILGEIAQFHIDTAQKYQPELAISSAVSLLSVILSRRFATNANNLTSLYCLGVAPSGEGKEHGLKMISSILRKSDNEYLIGGSWYSSDAAIFSVLKDKPRHIIISDEIGMLLTEANAKNNTLKQGAIRLIMEAAGRLDGYLIPTVRSTRGLNKSEGDAEKEFTKPIIHPAISLYGTTTPSTLYEAMNIDHIKSGFLGRFLVFRSKQDLQMSHMPKKSLNDIPQSILQWIKSITTRGGNLSFLDDPHNEQQPTVLQFTDRAWDLTVTFERELLELRRTLMINGMDVLVGRAREFSMRVALIAQLSINPMSYQIGEEATRWAIDIVRECFMSLVKDSLENVTASTFEKQQREFMAVLQEYEDSGVYATSRDLFKHRVTRKYKAKEKADIISALMDADEIEIMRDTSTGGRPRDVYRIIR